MNQLVAFTSQLDIPLADALVEAIKAFPTEDFSGIKTAIDLETKLNDMEQTFYVTVDNDKQVNAALANEASLKIDVDEQVENFHCHLPPVQFTEDDLNTDLCEEPTEFAEPIIVPDSELNDLIAILAEEQRKQYGSLEDPTGAGAGQTDALKDVLSCVSSMTSITNDISTLNDKEGNIRNTLINLEELLYNYSIMEAYFKKRTDTIDQLLGIFDPLITKERDFQSQIDLVQPIDTQAKTDLDAAIARLQQQNGTSSNTTTTNNTTTASTSTTSGSTPETQAHVDQLQSAYDTVHAQLVDLQTKLQEVKDTISFDISGISPFLKETDFEKTTDFLNKTVQEKEQARTQWLNDNLQSLFSGSSSVFGNVSAFSSRIELTQNSNSTTPNQSFDLKIKFKLVDVENVLAGRPKTYATSGSNITIEDPDVSTPSGILYDQFYNVWGDPDLFFSREERGLTADSNQAAPQLKGTGGEIFKSNFIQDNSKFQEFYSNFNSKHLEKVTLVKTNVIEPAVQQVVGSMEDIALKEVEYLFAYGKAFENLPAESSKLTDIITSVRQSSQQYIARIAELRADYNFLVQAQKDLLDTVEVKKQLYLKTPCAGNKTPNPPENEPPQPGSDPLGADTIQDVFPEDPDITKYCYWVKFAAYATSVNILPKFWPVGLKVPTPAGIINIPLPIIWIPVSVIVLTAGIFVIFIGQCGICPSPVVFFVGANGEKKFKVSIRPSNTELGSNASKAIIKLASDGGIAVKKLTSSLLNKINVPGFKPVDDPDSSSTVLDDLKDKIIKKVQKIGIPDITPITSRLTTHSTVADKKSALKEVVSKHLDKLTIPTLKLPKDASKVNPKPPAITEVLNQLTKLLKMDLPTISIPAADQVNLKTKLLSKIGGLKTAELPSTNVNGINFDTATETEKTTWSDKIRKALKEGLAVGHLKITPKELGLVTSVLGGGITFINPYKCRPGAKGLGVPPLPPAAIAGLGALKIAGDAFVDGLSFDTLKQMFLGSGGALTTGILAKSLTDALSAMPDVNIPNPSKVSIKDLLMDSSKKVVKMQMPSIPDPSAGVQVQIPIPGDSLKSAIKQGVDAFIETFPINDINFSNVSGIDMKQIIIGFVEGSFQPVQDLLDPILSKVSNYKKAKDKTFPETLGMKKVTKDDDMTVTVTKPAMDAAMIALKALSAIPFMAVAVAPQPFQKMHPILAYDDLPPWKRLTLSNFLFVCFLAEFCAEGKKTCGFQENP